MTAVIEEATQSLANISHRGDQSVCLLHQHEVEGVFSHITILYPSTIGQWHFAELDGLPCIEML